MRLSGITNPTTLVACYCQTMLVRLLCMAGTSLLAVVGASAQTYPNKPIRIVTNEVGGGADFVSRLIAQGLTVSLGQQVIVDNRGNIAGELAAKATPDAYTLLLNGGTLWLMPFLRDNMSYDPVKDLSPLSLTSMIPTVLVVHPSVAANSVKELIALARANPGKLNYGSGSSSAPTHLAAELFKSMANLNIVRIPFRGSGPALNGLIGGEVQMMFPNAAAAQPHIKSGRLKALAVASSQPSALAPGLPTVAATVPGFESASLMGMFAPARTPAKLVQFLNQEIVRVLNRAEVRQKLFAAGVDSVGTTPEQFAVTIKSEMARLGKVIRDGGIRAE